MSLSLALSLMVIIALVVATLTWLITRTGPASGSPGRHVSPAGSEPAGAEPAGRIPTRADTGATPTPHTLTAAPAIAALHPGMPDDRLLSIAPMVDTPSGHVTLRDWLVHVNPRHDHVWPCVVARFYERALADPAIADYFAGADLIRLQRHFLGALTIITERGLTVGMIRRLAAAHGTVRDSAGSPITGHAYDSAVSTLVEVLAEEDVPAQVIEQLAHTIEPLRAAVVAQAVTTRSRSTG